MSDQWSQPASAWPSNNGEPVVDVEAGQALQLTPEQKNAAIKHWLSAKADAEQAVETERRERAEVTAILFPTPKKGTQRYVSPEGFGAIKLVHGWTYTLGDKDKVDPADGQKLTIGFQVESVLDKIEELGERGRLIANRVVKWKPELSVSEYELLCASQDPVDVQARAMIDEILTVKPASPQLTFEPPKVQS